jgi:hypothetical protein
MRYDRLEIHERIILKEIIQKYFIKCGTEFICHIIVSCGRINFQF